jgi:predicted O-methyltransferase YrrM
MPKTYKISSIMKTAICHPQEYVRFLQDCLQPRGIQINYLRPNPEHNVPASRDFAILIDELKQLPALDLAIAKKMALIANHFWSDRTMVETTNSILDVRTHFQISSADGIKGRILSTIVRCAKIKRGVELGTGYGLSACFILEAMKSQGDNFHLATLEGVESQFILASGMLKKYYNDRVSCYHGWTQDRIQDIIKELSNFDFVFHDAGHSRQDYLRDFNAILPALSSGTIVIIDDINWFDPRFYDKDPQTYQGWIEVAHSPRVVEAVEIVSANCKLGLLLLM